MTQRIYRSDAIWRIRPVLAAVATAMGLILPTGCVSSDGVSGVSDDIGTNDRIGTAIVPGESLSGIYLAGRHAQITRDADSAIRYLKQGLAADPENEGLLNRAFLVLLGDGRVDEALVLAPRVVSAREESLFANLALAVDRVRAGDFVAADARLSELPQNGFTDFLVPLVRAWTLAGQGKTDEALAQLVTLEDRRGFEIFAFVHSSFINELAGRRDAALASFEKAAENQKNAMTTRFAAFYGGFLERAGRRDDALALYREQQKSRNVDGGLMADAIARASAGGVSEQEIPSAAAGVAEALFDLASVLGRQRAGDTGLLMGVLSLHLKPDFAEARMLVAEIMESQDRLERAIDFYDGIPRESRFWPTTQLRIADNLDALKRFDDAANKLRELAAAQPNDPDPLVELGRILHRHENYVEAVEAFNAAFARTKDGKPGDWRLYYSRGMSLERAKHWDLAEKDFLSALELEPEQPLVLNYLGYSWVDQGMHLERARKMIEKAVELRPTDGYIVDSLGWAMYKTGDYVGAARELERAVELRPHDPIINDHLGDALWRVGRREEARFQWRRALSFDPTDEDRLKIENKLKHGLPAKNADSVTKPSDG